MTEKKPTAAKTANHYTEGVGRRKTAVARVRLVRDSKKGFTVNGKPADTYLSTDIDRELVRAPLVATGTDSTYSVAAKVTGGGPHSQAQAIRHGVARALVAIDKELRPVLKPFGYLTRDPRAKERKKPGLKRARRAPQWSKR